MNRIRTIGQKWLVKELVLAFWTLKRCAKFHSNPIILSKVIVSTENCQSDFSHKTNTL